MPQSFFLRAACRPVWIGARGGASALDYAERRRIVLSDLEFPTLSYQWAVKPAAERVFVPSKDGIRVSPDLFESSTDDRTALVATSHVYYTSGAVQDIGAIAKAA